MNKFLMILCLTAATAWAELPHSAVPGGIASIIVGASHEPMPNVYYQQTRVAVIEHEQSWVALVGIPLSAKAGAHEIRVDGEGKSFTVTAKDYPEQRITLKTRKHIDLSKEDLARHKREKAKAQKVFKSHDLSQMPDIALLKPVEGPYSSPFGLKRFFNDEPRNPHSGLDIAAPTGTPIKAPAAGHVVLTGDFFFNGQVVYIDHGQGMITMFCHMSEIGVKEGQHLQKGDIVGKVGATGRVTGPHLHWSLSLNNQRVDPMLLLPKEAQ